MILSQMNDPFTKPEHIQGSAEWLAHRRNYIGGSDAPIVMGESPWRTHYQLWEEKLGLAPPAEINFAMRRGMDMEPEARRAFEKHTGLEVFPQVVYHPKNQFMMASLDGLTLGGATAVEIKCPGETTHALAVEGKIPPHYGAQLQHQLACLDLAMIYYWSFDGNGGVLIEVERDDDYITRMIGEEAAFWERVKTRDAPDFTDRDYACRDNAKWAVFGNRVQELDKIIKDAANEKDAIRQECISDASGRSCRGGGLTLTRNFPRGRVDYSSIPELAGVNLDEYRKESKEQWTLRQGAK